MPSGWSLVPSDDGTGRTPGYVRLSSTSQVICGSAPSGTAIATPAVGRAGRPSSIRTPWPSIDTDWNRPNGVSRSVKTGFAGAYSIVTPEASEAIRWNAPITRTDSAEPTGGVTVGLPETVATPARTPAIPTSTVNWRT